MRRFRCRHDVAAPRVAERCGGSSTTRHRWSTCSPLRRGRLWMKRRWEMTTSVVRRLTVARGGPKTGSGTRKRRRVRPRPCDPQDSVGGIGQSASKRARRQRPADARSGGGGRRAPRRAPPRPLGPYSCTRHRHGGVSWGRHRPTGGRYRDTGHPRAQSETEKDVTNARTGQVPDAPGARVDARPKAGRLGPSPAPAVVSAAAAAPAGGDDRGRQLCAAAGRG